MKLRSIREADLKGRRVLTRVDFNVPLSAGEDGSAHVADDTRIRAAVPTLAYMLQQGARLILCSHLGRPKGVDDHLRLGPVAPVLEELLSAELQSAGAAPVRVLRLGDCIGPEVEAAIAAAAPDEVVLLENLRFHQGEEANDPDFVSALAQLAEIYCSDAFGTVHRAHASTEGVAHRLPAYAGFLVEKEVAALSRIVENPAKPFVLVMGGAKISDKIELLENLIPKADRVLIGGAMANTFLRAQGFETGASLVEEGQLDTARRLIALADSRDTLLLLPVDYIVTDDVRNPRRVDTRLAHEIQRGDSAADIGPKTASSYADAISDAATVFWNGPLGVFEVQQFSAGTLAIANALASIYDSAMTVIGGGESVEAANRAGVASRIHHISTGGGASLEYVGGAELPGIQVLRAD
ncbi:phosphoglycerate kinase [bacterium]|nr:phosphoglycerate kinase [bacterium]